MYLRPRGLGLLPIGLVAVVTVILLAQAVGSGGVSPAREGSAVAGGSTHGPSGAQELSLAQASLALGSGPAGTTNVVHASVVPAAAPTTAYRWVGVTPKGGVAPSPRVSTMVWDASDGYVLLFGGGASIGILPLADTWTYVNGTWTNITASITGHPPATEQFSLAFDPSTQKVVLFGGENASGDYVDQTWTYHNRVWTNVTSTAGTPPAPRMDAAMATDTTDDEVVLTGGMGTGVTGQDTWTFKSGTWTNVTALAPLPAYVVSPTASDDPAGAGVLLTGVASYDPPNAGFHAITFLYTGGTWKNLTSTLASEPPFSTSQTAILEYLPASSVVVYYLGLIFNTAGQPLDLSATWEFVSGAWVNVSSLVGTGPGVALLAAGAVTPGDNSLILFGGAEAADILLATTWALSTPPSVTATASRSVVDVGMTVTFNGSATLGLDPNLPGWNFGDGSNASGFSVDHTYSAAGLYAAALTVTDAAGVSTTVSTPVSVNPMLVATASYPFPLSAPTAGTALGLVAEASGGTAPFTYAWTLGDGTLASSPTVTHTYANSGTYAVEVVVTDSLGQTSRSNITLVVAAAATTTLGLTSGTGLLLIIVIIALLAVAIVLGVLLLRKGRGPRGPVTQYTSTPNASQAPSGGPPPGAVMPPPGAMNPPPPGT